MDWRVKVALFEEIRREYEFGVGTIAGVARKVKVHRRMVREAIASAMITASTTCIILLPTLIAGRGCLIPIVSPFAHIAKCAMNRSRCSSIGMR